MTANIVDRFSDLPDDVLKHIISLLSERELMRLSILSTRWRKVCSPLPCLYLDLREYESRLTKLEVSADKDNFVRKILSPCETLHLYMFRLISDDSHWQQYVASSITESVVMKFSPRIVSIDVPSCYSHEVSISSIFSCKFLEELYLTFSDCKHRPRKHYIVQMPRVKALFSLRKLHLKNATFYYGTICRILSRCPEIEDLSLKSCCIKESWILHEKLKFLSLDDCSIGDPYDKSKLSICAPSLASLKFASSPDRTVLMNFPFLSYASVDVRKEYCYDNIFNSLSSIQHLELCSSNLKAVLDKQLSKLPRFANLKSLSLNGWCMACHLGPVVWFLENSTNLEKLTLCLNRQHCLVKNKTKENIFVRDHPDPRQTEVIQSKLLKKVELRLSISYKKCNGPTISFFKKVKGLENAQFVIC
ncbi:F-box/FBD/LRR protein [Rhynchospora pubera]|uniref:F-box/FBD/LRR protein n=1 Tax=Rhynchospora pubera TaxID=906938 RepID=A0AAV8ETT0_9POAL|nr:F-box/FBD/LRR protein [Rhynchospora pubera]